MACNQKLHFSHMNIYSMIMYKQATCEDVYKYQNVVAKP